MFRRRSFYNSTDLFKMNTKFSELLLLIKFLVLTNAIIDFSTNSKENSSPVFRRWPLLEDLDCSRILAGDKVYIEKISSHPEKRIRLRQESSLNWSTSCSAIYERNHFDSEPMSAAEENFPIAIARNVFRDYFFLESELSASYAPQNWYCYTLDADSDAVFKKRVRNLANCFPNIIVNDAEFEMDSMGHNQTAALLECMNQLIHPERKWRYLVALQNHDIQMKTNEELVQIFKWMNGANDIGIWNTDFVEGFVNSSIDWSFDGLGLIKNETLRRKIRARKLPQRLQFAKSYYQSSLSREFVEFVIEQLDVSKAAEEIDTGGCFIDEFLLASLDATDALQIPGGFTHSCLDRGFSALHLTRYNVYTCDKETWPFPNPCTPNPLCHNHRDNRHGVCLLGVEEIASHLKRSHSLFYNKAMPEHDFGAVMCWHEQLFNRSHFERGIHRLNPFVYKQLPQVRFQSLKESSRSPMEERLRSFDCAYRIPARDRIRIFNADLRSGWRTYARRRFMSFSEQNEKQINCYKRHATSLGYR